MRALRQTFISDQVERKGGERGLQTFRIDIAVFVHPAEHVGGAFAATGGIPLRIVERWAFGEACQQRGLRHVQ